MDAIGNITSGIFSLVSSRQQAKSLKVQARAADAAAKAELLRAKQTEAEHARTLNDTVATIDALRAGRGASLDSPTARLIERRTRKRSADVMLAQTLGIRESAYGRRLEGAGYRNSASAALLGGWAKATPSLLKGYDQIFDDREK